jgi:hypothetical protein
LETFLHHRNPFSQKLLTKVILRRMVRPKMDYSPSKKRRGGIFTLVK